MTDFGIDISHFNQVNDWNAVRGNNITFASVKVTESTDFLDHAATAHVNGARGAGIHVGGYHFARPGRIAEQVQHFAANLRVRDLTAPGSLAPMLDVEDDNLVSSANSFVKEFINRMRSDAGIRRLLVYANLNFWKNFLRPDEWADNDVSLWIARFNGDPGHPGFEHPKLALHQHTDQGNVPGIPNHVDRDATIGGHTLSELLVGGNGAGPVVALPSGETHTVKPGDTLTKIAREHNTTVAVLVALNHIPNPDLIHPGQVLRLR